MGKTLIQIKDKIEEIATNHRQINHFGDEETWFINASGTTNYPVFWSVYNGLELRKGEKGYRFQFICIDLLEQDRGNIHDIQNDTEQIISDVLAELKWGNDPDIDIKVESFIIEKIDEPRFDEIVSGHMTDVTIWTDFKLNSCTIPTIT